MSSKQQGLAARLWLGRDAEPPIEQPSSGSQGTAAKRGKEKARQKAGALRERAAAAVAHPAGRAALIGAGVWLAARGTVEAFHRVRRSYLRQLLFDLTAALEELGQEHWVDFGCLLGIHRDGDLIAHDNDIDLAVLNPEWHKLLAGLQRTLPSKYSLRVVTPNDQPQSAWLRVYCPLGMADLFGAYDAGHDEIYVDCGHGDTMHIDRHLILPAGRMEWRGRTLRTPANKEGTLAVRYGPTWRTPAYMEKGADTVEGNKLHSRMFRALGVLGIRI
ncbi:hypothetical protein C2E20_1924 [Micractinium conductrix]|uniref:LicD family protein n=1 Tax=Micractinium conductrix TaxID=554055 RepID=A0A2P6VLV1_9CHLO|nr:hypothetical protein C2E20_1924 [Micractinium conductrix]|eukprot:PSC75064.1 hypothetical protein C2E20_1924 [Micractinium conductrix]